MVLVPFVMPVHPCAKRWSSLLIALSHRSVMGDGYFGDRVYYTVAVFFDFNDRACILIVDKFARD